MAVFYHRSCVAPSLVKIAKPGEHPPVVGTFYRGRGVQKRSGFGRGRGPGRTMIIINKPFKKSSVHLNEVPLKDASP